MTLAFTHHALVRYHTRWVPQATRETAAELLAVLARQAAPMNAKTARGDELWSAGVVVFVVKRDIGRPVAVTVLPRRARGSEEAEERALADALMRLDTTATG